MNKLATPALSLVVIRSPHLTAALSFYRALGLSFEREQHGSGPVHYSCDLGRVVLEIYSGQSGVAPESKANGTLLGFKVNSLDEALANLRTLGIEPQAAPKMASWGRWVNVLDPDGRVVQLNQAVP